MNLSQNVYQMVQYAVEWLDAVFLQNIFAKTVMMAHQNVGCVQLMDIGDSLVIDSQSGMEKALKNGRLTPWDFCGMIQWLTDNADSRNVQDVYRQFNQIQRQWRAGWTVYHALCQESIFLRIGGKTQMRE
ncbi:hypothetical protein BU17DRAFT_72566 [Hysterangium stoloniferum]|nr:hypothetical protein BU17DRAFT_72566 [Hysterangium stoloniferum]